MANSGHVLKEFNVVTRGTGMPDYSLGVSSGQKETNSKQYSLSDHAELAERLGATHSIDRRGNIVLTDDFNNGLSQWSVATGCVWDGTFAFQGGFSCAMTPPGGPAILAKLLRPMSIATAWGIEFTFWLANANMYFQGFLTRNVNNQQTELTFAVGRAGLSVMIGPATSILAAPYPMRTQAWYTVKCVADFNNSNFVRATVNDLEFDLSNYVMFTGPTAFSEAYCAIQITCGSATGGTGYVDNVIVTQNNTI
jgi:hypothetical protein